MDKLHIGLATLFILGVAAYLLTISVNSTTAQEISVPTATATPAQDVGGEPGDTVVVEVCSIDRETGEETCVEELRPAGKITPRLSPPKSGDERNRVRRDCYNDPGAGQMCSEDLYLSELSTTLTLTGDDEYDSDTFTVRAEYLIRGNSYKMRVRRESRSNFDIGFDAECNNHEETVNVPSGDYDYYDYEHTRFVIYGCSENGGTLIVELLDGNSVVEHVTIEQNISVVDNRPEPTPTHTATHTPTAASARSFPTRRVTTNTTPTPLPCGQNISSAATHTRCASAANRGLISI